MAQQRELITFRNAEIIWNNFKGKKSDINPLGNREFNLLFEQELADEMLAKGFNVREKRKREGEEETPDQFTLKVNVKYGDYPPQVYLINPITNSMTLLGEGLVGLLDELEPERVDLTITPYHYDFRGRRGISTYLKTLYFTPYLDPLAQEYATYQLSSSAGDAPMPLAIDGVVEGEIVD